MPGPGAALPNGQIGKAGRGVVTYENIEGLRVLGSPRVSFLADVYAILEGDAFAAFASAEAFGSTNRFNGPITFDIDGDGQFGDAIATLDPSGLYRLDLDWTRLVDLGLGDDGTYTIAVRATNEDDASSLAFADLTIADLRPTVTLTGPPTVSVGATATVLFDADDPSPADRVTEWLVD